MDQSPEQYIRNLTNDVELIIKSKVISSRKKIAEQIIGSIIGVRYTTWGEAEIVGDTLVNAIKDKIDPELKARFLDMIAQECNALLEKTLTSPNGALRKNLRYRLNYFIKNQIEEAFKRQSSKAIDIIGKEVGKMIDERLSEELEVWRVAKRLKDAHAESEDD